MTEGLAAAVPGMQKISSLSLEKHEGPYEKWPRQTRLYVDGRDTQRTVPGYVIEAQYRCEAGYLLVLSWDCPYEESCTCVLLDEQFNTVAKVALGAMYCSFLLNTHWPLSPTSLRLHFYGDYFYDLHVETAMLFGKPVSRPLLWGVLQRLRRFFGLTSRDQDKTDLPMTTELRLRLEPFDEFQNDLACVASIQELELKIQRIRAVSSGP